MMKSKKKHANALKKILKKSFYFLTGAAVIFSLSACTIGDNEDAIESGIGGNIATTDALKDPPAKLLSQGNYNGYDYDLYEGYVSIRGYQGNDVDLHIPSEIEGTKVTIIGESAFEGLTSLNSVEIPSTIIKIEWDAFGGCSSLRTVRIPDSVEFIGSAAFAGCGLFESIILPPKITEIPSFTFYGCSSLRNIKIPDHVEFIGEGAFLSCTALANIEIGKSVSAIDECAFDDTPWFDGLTDEFVIVGDGVLIDYNGAGEVVNIPSSVKFISSAFRLNQNITEVNIPDTTTAIGSFAFQNCSLLTTVSMPNSVTSISREAFADCGRLCNIEISNSLKYLGEGAFSGCASLRSIILPDTLTRLGTIDMYLSGGIFYGCRSLRSVILPKNLKSICRECFANCDKLTSIVLPESVEDIEENAFESTQCIICPKGSFAEQYAIQLGIPYETLASDLIGRFANADFEYDVYPNDIEITRYLGASLDAEIPSKIDGKDVTSIRTHAFCLGEVSSLHIPNSVSLIEENAFCDLPDITIICEAGSAAEKYAEKYGLNCPSLGHDPQTQHPNVHSDRKNTDAPVSYNVYTAPGLAAQRTNQRIAAEFDKGPFEYCSYEIRRENDGERVFSFSLPLFQESKSAFYSNSEISLIFQSGDYLVVEIRTGPGDSVTLCYDISRKRLEALPMGCYELINNRMLLGYTLTYDVGTPVSMNLYALDGTQLITLFEGMYLPQYYASIKYLYYSFTETAPYTQNEETVYEIYRYDFSTGKCDNMLSLKCRGINELGNGYVSYVDSHGNGEVITYFT